MKKKAFILTILLYAVCAIATIGFFYYGYIHALLYKLDTRYVQGTEKTRQASLDIALASLAFPFILFPLAGIIHFFFSRKIFSTYARIAIMLVFIFSSLLPLGINTGIQGYFKYQQWREDERHDGLNVRYWDSWKKIPRLEENYKSGHMDGEQRYYYKSGQLKEIRTYKNGKLNGPRRTYYESGQLRTTEKLKDDRSVGTDYSYYESGKTECVGVNRDVGGRIESNCYYENGKLKKRVTYDENDYVVTLEKYNPDGSVVAPTPTPTLAPGQLP